MIGSSIVKRAERFFFEPQSPVPIALFRIGYGVCAVMTLVLLHKDWMEWFGVHAWISLSTVKTLEPSVRIDLFTVLPPDDNWIRAFFWFFLIVAILLTFGLASRVSSVIVFLCLASVQQRQLFITHGGDTFLRVTGFFLMFAPSGEALSLDRLIRLMKGNGDSSLMPRAPWAQRMIQFELSLVYVMSFWWKAKGHAWWDGTALYYVIHLQELRRFPIPQWIENSTVLKLGGWLTLVFELAMGLLVWFKPFRYPLLVLGILFHLTLEYALNIPMFQWDILSAYVLFLDPADLTCISSFIQARAGSCRFIRSN